MEVYLIKHKDYKTSAIGENEVYIESVNAFLKKKDAQKWLDRVKNDGLCIVSATLDN